MADTAFTVKLASTGQEIPVAADKTVLDALHGAGLNVPISCGQGICGTCLTRVVEGTPDHRDMYLTPEEQDANDQFTPRCPCAKSVALVLDL